MLTSAVKGATIPTQVITWLREDGRPQELSGEPLTGKLRKGGQVRLVVGALIVIDAACGVFEWKYDPADVAEAGAYDVQFADGSTKTFVSTWVVEDSI